MKPRPIHVIAVVVLAAVGIAAWPGAGERLIYDRAAIMRGEWWRLLTGHWVHFSTSHLLFDALALGVSALLVRNCSNLRLLATLAVSVMAIPAALFCWQPELGRYAGLSGLAMSVLALAGVEMLRGSGRARVVGVVLLLGIMVKLAVEPADGGFALASINVPGVEPATLAHWVGVFVGVAGGAVRESARLHGGNPLRACLENGGQASCRPGSGASSPGAGPAETGWKPVDPTGCKPVLLGRLNPAPA